ncbi:MAG: cadherin-like beta sandwich domain-containing protein, partial [Lachnospiraceae bacterium]|nr:cadherin-like beta sandwich domain-containing protein [Lachnospiraceae bacterium]
MKKWIKKVRLCILLAAAVLAFGGMNVLASEDDNSLSSLGITTEGATVSPEFVYSTWSYTVTVPGGTKELSLDPVPSSSSAVISDISGTTLNEDGTGYVTITVQAGNGSTFTYELNVVSDGNAPAAETESETETETETE